MTLDEVDLEGLLLDRVADARRSSQPRKSETLEEAISGAMEGSR